jgi:arylsulfatase A-like enzyme
MTTARDEPSRYGDANRPNILWIVSEDCPPRLGCYGDHLARTPNLDALAADGILFERAYSTAPVCAPSRFGMLTGVPPESCPPANQMRATAHIPDALPTYPRVLRQAGYYCTNNAKTDYNADVDPAAIWNESSRVAHWRNRPEGAPFLAVFNIDGTHESSIFEPSPLVVDPHAIALPSYLPDSPGIRGDLARHYGRIRDMDVVVGELVAQLREDGLYEDTVILYTSDHGGVHPRSKRFCYDEGLHVPLILRVPTRFGLAVPDPGTRVGTPVSTLAIPRTIADIAGAGAPKTMAAPSLVSGRLPDDALVFGTRDRMDERIDLIRTVRDRRYRYIRNYLPHRPWGLHQAYAWRAAGYREWERAHRDGRLTPAQDAFWHGKPACELYDTVADPDEVENLAGRPELAAVENRLCDALHRHMIKVGDAGFRAEPLGAVDAQSHADGARRALESLIELADLAIQRNPDNVSRLLTALSDDDADMRRWAAMGLLMMADRVPLDPEPLRRASAEEHEPAAAIAIAEAWARLTNEAEPYRILGRYLRPSLPFPLRLAALNALGALDPERVAPMRRTVREAALDGNEYVSRAVADLLGDSRHPVVSPVG